MNSGSALLANRRESRSLPLFDTTAEGSASATFSIRFAIHLPQPTSALITKIIINSQMVGRLDSRTARRRKDLLLPEQLAHPLPLRNPCRPFSGCFAPPISPPGRAG